MKPEMRIILLLGNTYALCVLAHAERAGVNAHESSKYRTFPEPSRCLNFIIIKRNPG